MTELTDSDVEEEIVELFEREFENDRVSEVDRVTARRCASDRYNGVQVNAYGPWVDARTAIDVVAEMPDAGIEALYHTTDDEPHLGFFIARLPSQEHPGLVD